MLHMTTAQSWNTMLVVLAIVAALMWLVIQIERRRRWRARNSAAAEAPTEQTPIRHLSLVPELKSADPELYDWQTQGI